MKTEAILLCTRNLAWRESPGSHSTAEFKLVPSILSWHWPASVSLPSNPDPTEKRALPSTTQGASCKSGPTVGQVVERDLRLLAHVLVVFPDLSRTPAHGTDPALGCWLVSSHGSGSLSTWATILLDRGRVQPLANGILIRWAAFPQVPFASPQLACFFSSKPVWTGSA